MKTTDLLTLHSLAQDMRDLADDLAGPISPEMAAASLKGAASDLDHIRMRLQRSVQYTRTLQKAMDGLASDYHHAGFRYLDTLLSNLIEDVSLRVE